MYGQLSHHSFIALKQMLGAFFDDSGTHASSPLAVIGGLLGSGEQWDAFASAWELLLSNPLPGKPKLRQFHLAPCRAGDGEFGDYSLAERDRITFLFRRIIVEVGLVTIAAAVDKLAWNELVVGDLVEKLGNPIELCFVRCLDTMLNIIRLRKPGEKVFILFDQGTRRELEPWSRLYRGQPARYPEIDGISFGPVSKLVALQGADMIATETYQFGQQWLKDREKPVVNAHFGEYLRRRLSVGLIVDRAAKEEAIAQMRTALGRST